MANLLSQGGNSLSKAELRKSGSSLFEYYGFTKKDERKYPVISRILKQLTPERIKKEIETIQKIKLPPDLQKWVKAYEKVGERSDFIWRWTYKVPEVSTLSCVSKRYLKSLQNSKFFTSLLIILLDDVADKIKNKNLLNKLLKIPFGQTYINYNQLNQKEKNYIELSINLWKNIQHSISKYPRFGKFEDIFEHDIAQIFNSMKYAYSVNKNPYLINKKEYCLYLPYSMQAMVYSTFDLMCSKFNIKEIGLIRAIILKAQQMTRIGNCISTWEREIKENDFTSAIIVYAIEMRLIKPDDLKKKNKLEVIKRIKSSNIEIELLKEWEDNYYDIRKQSEEIKTVDIKKLLSGLEKLLFFELASKNYK